MCANALEQRQRLPLSQDDPTTGLVVTGRDEAVDDVLGGMG